MVGLNPTRSWNRQVAGVLHEPADFKMPYIDVHLGIDDVLGDTVEQVVRRNRLNDAAFVLGAVIAERSRAIQLPRQPDSATSRCETNSAQHECTASDSWSELVGRDIALRCPDGPAGRPYH